MTDHVWNDLNSSTNDISCGNYRGLFTGISETPEAALRCTQLHFRLMLRMVGVVTQGRTVIGHTEPQPWPDATLS